MFAWYDGKLSAADYYVGRVSLLDNSYGYGRASVNLTSIRETDSGWFECRVIFPNRTPSTRNNGTWFHLAVESGSLIKIPPINQTVMEGEMAFFHCVTKGNHIVFASIKGSTFEISRNQIYFCETFFHIFLSLTFAIFHFMDAIFQSRIFHTQHGTRIASQYPI